MEFTKNPEADNLLNNLKEFPHAFVLACVMDRQWGAPLLVYNYLRNSI